MVQSIFLLKTPKKNKSEIVTLQIQFYDLWDTIEVP